MTITSKYNGKCKQCGGHIGKGDKVEWEKGAGIRHTACAPPAPTTFRPTPKPGQQQRRPDPPQAPRSYPPKVAAQIVPAGTPGPYHGKFRLLNEFYHQLEKDEAAARQSGRRTTTSCSWQFMTVTR